MGRKKIKIPIEFHNTDYTRNSRHGSRISKPRYPPNITQRSYPPNIIQRNYPPHSYNKYNNYNYVFSQNRYTFYRKREFKKTRPLSPVLGSSEHMNKKIEETSAIIMHHLLNPEETIVSGSVTKNNSESLTEKHEPLNKNVNKTEKCNKIKKKVIHKSDKIHEKIMNHLSNLTDGRKRNLINSDKSEYDLVIQQIMRQKRLEISRTLRTVFSKTDRNDSIHVVNPDVGIKEEDLPQNLLAELRHVLNFDVDATDKDWIDSCPDDILLNVLNNFIQGLDSPEFYSTLSKIKSEENLEIVEIIDDDVIDSSHSTVQNGNFTGDMMENDFVEPKIEVKEEFDIEDHTITECKDVEIKLEPEEHSDNLSDHLNTETDNSSTHLTDKTLAGYVEDNKSKSKLSNVSVQTEDLGKMSLNKFIEVNFEEIPSNFNDAVKQMYQIDDWISQLTTYRQNIFVTLCSLPKENLKL